MTQKTYNQYCPVSHSLDLIGERWALLIVRDLMMGPKRFSDLARGLPGIGTNILTTRLKSLGDSGLIQTRYLPPPAASTVYELTERGQSLESVLAALMTWGEQSLGAPKTGQSIRPVSVMFKLRLLFKSEVLIHSEACHAVSIRGALFNGEFGVEVRDGAATVTQGTPDRPDLEWMMDYGTLRDLVTQRVTLPQAIESGALHLEGEPRRSELLAQLT